VKHIDIEEFCRHASDFLVSGEAVTIVRDGEAMGMFVPSEEIRRARLKEALDRLGETVQKILDETGMTEDELARLFDLNRPLPDEPFPARDLATVTTDASGH
jgi:antitoxin (DNA-binding transcriptional repressor) of toxin-antitoxin stability system